MGAHTTSDDPTRYRVAAEVDVWRERDPILRLRAHLVARGLVDDAWFTALQAESDALAVHVREGCLALPDPDPLSMFDHVYVDEHPLLAAERREFAAYRETFLDGGQH
jgi:2-oxoisovalerate dehydrogenase E1 component alpha subunit